MSVRRPAAISPLPVPTSERWHSRSGAANSAAVRKVADLLFNFVRHPVRHEALEPRPRLIDHTQGCVMGIRDTGSGLDDPLQDTVE